MPDILAEGRNNKASQGGSQEETARREDSPSYVSMLGGWERGKSCHIIWQTPAFYLSNHSRHCTSPPTGDTAWTPPDCGASCQGRAAPRGRRPQQSGDCQASGYQPGFGAAMPRSSGGMMAVKTSRAIAAITWQYVH